MSLYLDASIVVPLLVDEAASSSVERFLLRSEETLILGDLATLEVASSTSPKP